MKLILIRHAKSAWDDPLLDDHDRGLTKRGRRSARLIGDWLVDQSCLPDHVLCSTATRARETMDGIVARLGTTPGVTLAPQLYLAAPEVMWRHIRRQSTEVLMVVGHNPGMAELATMLAKSPARHHDFHRYPTAATTILDFAADSWQAANPGQGEVTQFTVPRDLEG